MASTSVEKLAGVTKHFTMLLNTCSSIYLALVHVCLRLHKDHQQPVVKQVIRVRVNRAAMSLDAVKDCKVSDIWSA